MGNNESTKPATLEKYGIRFSDREIAEVDAKRPGSRPVLRIPRDRIREIHLPWGIQAARPLVQLILGGLFLGSGFYFLLRMLWPWLREGGVLHGEIVIGFVSLGVIGGWLLFTALRRGFYLQVRTEKATEKVRFDRHAARPEIEAFLKEAGLQLNYVISVAELP